MYRRVVRLQLPDHNSIITRRVHKLLHSYEFLMNFKKTNYKMAQTFVWIFLKL